MTKSLPLGQIYFATKEPTGLKKGTSHTYRASIFYGPLYHSFRPSYITLPVNRIIVATILNKPGEK